MKIHTNHIDIHYDIAGNPNGPWLTLSSSYQRSSSAWLSGSDQRKASASSSSIGT